MISSISPVEFCGWLVDIGGGEGVGEESKEKKVKRGVRWNRHVVLLNVIWIW
jgi:hypothetical protein